MRIPISVAIGLAFLVTTAAQAQGSDETRHFAVLRNDTQIGTNTITVGRDGADTRVQIVTHITVGLAFITLYKFDQTETERWSGQQFVALSSETDDNGKVHRVSANNQDGRLVVEGDGKVRRENAAIFPISLWSPSLPQNCLGLDPEDGNVVPVSVIYRGEDDLVIAGRTEHAHHFQIKTVFSQDVWYDAQNRLIQVEMRERDGSTIRYQLT